MKILRKSTAVFQLLLLVFLFGVFCVNTAIANQPKHHEKSIARSSAQVDDHKTHKNPDDTSIPHEGERPLRDAVRWNSPYDGEGPQPEISVFLKRAAYIRVTVHACSDSVEVGGVLVGQWYADEESDEEDEKEKGRF